MTDLTRILVVAATARELAPSGGWRTLVCGVGPVESAIATSAAIAAEPPAAIVHVGIAGARRASGIPLGALIVGTESVYADLGVGPEWAPHTVRPDARLVQAVRRAIPEARPALIGTSASVNGTRDVDVEAMEGFAVLRAAAVANIPAVEVRAISNEIEETDRGRWRFDAACAAIIHATPRIVSDVAACVR
jgi:nucleoside phosphorylase